MVADTYTYWWQGNRFDEEVLLIFQGGGEFSFKRYFLGLFPKK